MSHDARFPGETPAYRTARDELLQAEHELRRRIEEVAAQRRRLPLGGAVPEDYVFEEAAEGRPVKLSELFAGEDTLVLYSYMFSAEMAEPCPMCTPFLDGLEGNAEHIQQRVGLAIVAKSPPARLRELARTRGWRRLRLVSSAKNRFNRDYHGEDSAGDQDSRIHTFVRRPDGVHHFYSSELNLLPSESGQDPRHIDLLWPLWNVLDLTPAGRGTDWRPSLSYA
jgi:predicted dithiol-disulfide oxidoreductase (DUF899 family)